MIRTHPEPDWSMFTIEQLKRMVEMYNLDHMVDLSQVIYELKKRSLKND